jgi:hypothetical protein
MIKVKDMRLVYGALIVLFVAIISGSIYQLYSDLGGRNVVAIDLMPAIKRTVVGKHFQTRYTDKQIEAQFVKCRELLEKQQIAGDMIVITYLQDTVEGNYVDQFIGIALHEDMAEIPGDFEVMDLESKERYVVMLKMHPLVRPTPEELEKMVFSLAAKDGRKLLPMVMEIHYADNSMALEGWVE